MNYSSLKQLIMNRRSVRRYKADPVPADVVAEIVDCARYAPSDTNSQTWEFIAILSSAKVQEISDITWDELHTVAARAAEQGKDKESRLLLRSFGPYCTAFANAPALLVLLSTPYASKFRDKIFDPLELIDPLVWEVEGAKSSSLAAQNIMLAAHAMGLATCPMTGPVLFAEQRLKEVLGIPDHKQVNMMMALGYPNEHPSMPKRKELAEILTIVN